MKRKRNALPDMSDLTSEQRFQLISDVALEGLKDLYTEAGFEDYRLILCVEAPNDDEADTHNAGTLVSGRFPDKKAAFVILLEHASAMADSLGFKFLVSEATGPENPVQGQG